MKLYNGYVGAARDDHDRHETGDHVLVGAFVERRRAIFSSLFADYTAAEEAARNLCYQTFPINQGWYEHTFLVAETPPEHVRQASKYLQREE